MPKKLEHRLRSAKRSIASYSSRLRRRRKNSRRFSTDPNLISLQSTLAQHGLDSPESSDSSHPDFVFDDDAVIDNEAQTMLRAKMENLCLCSDLIEAHGNRLIKAISREKALCRSTLDALVIFKITSQAMMRTANDITQFLINEGKKLLQKQNGDLRMELERENVELKLELMKMKNQVGLKCLELTGDENVNDSDLEDLFYDAADFTPQRFDSLRISRRSRRSTLLSSARSKMARSRDHRPTPQTENHSEAEPAETDSKETLKQVEKSGRRSRVNERPSNSMNYLSLMKNYIGKDLSRITMPLNFNEPLSALQRMTEDLEYSSILDRAVGVSDPFGQLAHIGVFAVSGYSTSALRTTKPFNPLLGETYECDRTDDLGWKSVAEQVSHHPPVSAMHATGNRWTFSQNYKLTTRIRAKTLSVTPVGQTTISFDDERITYTYSKATTTTTIANIVTGKMVTDNIGQVVITNDANGGECTLRFHETGYFSRDAPRRITGEVMDESGAVRYRIEGYWDKEARIVDECTKTSKSIWTCNELPLLSHRMHSFSKFEIELNEPEDGVAPTDSRLRPDQRQMEDGDWESAARTKEQLEEQQRERKRLKEEEEHIPLWFRKTDGGYEFTNEYWTRKEKGDWENCVDIFSIPEETKESQNR